ncbi:HGGxSTG domain-containing protein [Dechloromonas sp. ARDL1]|uniref:HGGxSTG domain-containing protein n=1 Tax=Dechloromonas sp. ARDL1 TaxID=3322121 RepID=UPI003DA71C00
MDTCGAKTRAGTPCKQKAIYSNGRCKFHGGLATGPTTEAGKEQSRINGRKGGRPRKDDPKVTPREPGGKVSVRGNCAELSNQVYVLAPPEPPKIVPEKPKSWILKEANYSQLCERCAMFASNGACLAVAKGVIPSRPTGDTCSGFSDFEKPKS